MGIEPTYPAWKAGVLADVLHLREKARKGNAGFRMEFMESKERGESFFLLSIFIIPKIFIKINYFRINHLIYSL